VMPLKGVFLLKFIYKSLAERSMGDIDLLVPKEDLLRADSALKLLDYQALEEIRDPIYSPYRNSFIYLKQDGTYTIFLHLHFHLVNASIPLFFYRIKPEEIWEHSKRLRLAQGSVYLPCPHHLLLYLVEHAMKHSFSEGIQLEDIARLLKLYRETDLQNEYRSLFRELSWQELSRCAQRWGLLRPLYYAITLLSERKDLEFPELLIKRAKAQPLGFEGRYFLGCLKKDRHPAGLSILGYLSCIERVSEKIKFLLGALFPPVDQMKGFGKYPSFISYLKRIKKAVQNLLGNLVG
jgi:hypothetical protein